MGMMKHWLMEISEDMGLDGDITPEVEDRASELMAHKIDMEKGKWN